MIKEGPGKGGTESPLNRVLYPLIPGPGRWLLLERWTISLLTFGPGS